MKTRTLGNDAFTVSEVGLGCWQFGGDFGPMDQDTANQVMQAAVDSGITFFDTANVYGAGLSESFIGQFLQSCPVPIRVATKFGRGDVFPDGYTEPALRTAIEQACQRLQVDALDLLQLHCIPTEVLQTGPIFDWLRSAQSEGLIKHFGASVESDEQALICLDQPGITSLQIIFNLFRQKPLATVLPRAQQLGVGIIVRLPLASGLLAGKYTRDTQFTDSHHRTYNRNGEHFNVGETFAGIPFEMGIELVDAIKPLTPEGLTMAQMSQRWILDHPAVSTIITGAKTPDQVKANASVSNLPKLPAELHEKLAAHYQQHVHTNIRGPY